MGMIFHPINPRTATIAITWALAMSLHIPDHVQIAPSPHRPTAPLPLNPT